MATKNVNIKVSETGAQKASSSLNKVDSSISKIAKSAITMGAAYFSAQGIIRGLSESIKLAGIQEQAEKKLSTALGKTSSELLNYASSMQQVTTYGDEATISALGTLAAFTKNEEELKLLTTATMDMASALGMDLESAAQLVGKSFGTTTNALTRYGVEVDGAAGSTERLTQLTQGITNLWGGQAQAAADTMQGSIQSMKNAIGDTAESIGKQLQPLVISLTEKIREAQPAIQAFIQQVGFMFLSEDEQQAIKNEQALLKFTETIANKTFPELQKLNMELLKKRKFFNDAGQSVEYTDDQLKLITDTIVEFTSVTEIALPAIKGVSDEIELISPVPVIELNKAIQSSIDIAPILAQSLGVAFNPDMTGGDAIKSFITSLLNAMEGVILASAAVNKALSFAWVPGLGLAGIVASLAALEAAKVGVSRIKFAATGADFVTNGPQLMMVGENPGGRERVQVTPQSSPNVNGPQGSNITINVGTFIGNDDGIDRLGKEIEKRVQKGFIARA